MHRIELAALCSVEMRWEKLVADLPPTLESIGLVHDDAAADGVAEVLDHGEDGCVILLQNVALARQAALALAKRSGVAVELFEVVGTAGSKRFKFRTTAWRALATGELRPGEGRELDLEDPEENWGGGPLETQANRVLDLFAELNRFASHTLKLGYKRGAAARPSTPRIATLLTAMRKAKSHTESPQPDGRYAVRIELATGGTQTSYCTQAEYEELARLLAGKAHK